MSAGPAPIFARFSASVIGGCVPCATSASKRAARASRQLLRHDREQQVGVVVARLVRDHGEHARPGRNRAERVARDLPQIGGVSTRRAAARRCRMASRAAPQLRRLESRRQHVDDRESDEIERAADDEHRQVVAGVAVQHAAGELGDQDAADAAREAAERRPPCRPRGAGTCRTRSVKMFADQPWWQAVARPMQQHRGPCASRLARDDDGRDDRERRSPSRSSARC